MKKNTSDEEGSEEKVNEEKIKRIVTQMEGVSTEEREEMYKLLQDNVDVFSTKPGRFQGIECHLDTYEHEPFREKERPIPYRVREAVQNNIKKLLDDGIIECQGSNYNSALVVIPKKNGEVRVCLDARKLNRILIPCYDSPLRIEEVIKKFKGKVWLTSTDVTSGYFNVRLDESSRKYTAFSWKGIQYRYLVLPFGLKISGQMFIRSMERCLCERVKKICRYMWTILYWVVKPLNNILPN